MHELKSVLRSTPPGFLAVPYYLIAFLGMVTGSVSSKLPGVAILGILTLLCIAQIVISLGAVTVDPEKSV